MKNNIITYTDMMMALQSRVETILYTLSFDWLNISTPKKIFNQTAAELNGFRLALVMSNNNSLVETIDDIINELFNLYFATIFREEKECKDYLTD